MICTFTGFAGPTKFLFGVNVIVLFVLSKTYSPSAVVRVGTSAPASFTNVSVFGSNSTCSPLLPRSAPLLKFTVLSLLASVSTLSNTIVDTCFLPCTSVVADGSFVGVTGVISGVYVVWTFTPFDPVACTDTGSTAPV